MPAVIKMKTVNALCHWHVSLRGVWEENFWRVTNKCSASRDSFLFFCPCLTLPCTVSAVKCQTVCDLPTGAVQAIQRALQTFAQKLWVGKETSDNMHLLREPLCSVILGHTNSCHAKRLCHTCQTTRKAQTLGSYLDKYLKSVLTNVTHYAPRLCVLVDAQSSLGDAMTYQQRTQGRLNNNLTDSFLLYLIHSDKERPRWIMLSENKDNVKS